LDEPFVELDEDSKSKVIAVVREQTHRDWIIVVTHNAGDAGLLGYDYVTPLPARSAKRARIREIPKEFLH
jgi:ABC-type multidrug transport system ATPase subunit